MNKSKKETVKGWIAIRSRRPQGPLTKKEIKALEALSNGFSAQVVKN